MTRVWFLILICAGLAIYVWQQRQKELRPWSDEEVAVIESLWIGNLEPLAADPSNAVADDPIAAQLGHRLFFDERLSQTGTISCATCHQPDKRFTDGRPKGVAIGVSKRNTLSIIGAAYSPWLYWDGRRDSLWSQALSPLEDPNEHGTNREHVVITVLNDRAYRSKYQSLFGEVPDPMDSAATDTAFANIGKVIAAYERQLLPGPSRFDAYASAVAAGNLDEQAETFTADEKRGLRLFIGEANCTQCHNGPLLTNNEFHNTGLINFPGEVPDKGRVVGVCEVLEQPFNCKGAHNDDPSAECTELEFVRTGAAFDK